MYFSIILSYILQFDNLQSLAMNLKAKKNNWKTKSEQLEKESAQLKQENAEIIKFKESHEVQKKIIKRQRSKGQVYQKEIEKLKKEIEDSKKQNEEKTKQLEVLRIRAQEFVYTSKIERLEAEKADLKQKIQSSSEGSSRVVSANQPTPETTTKDSAAGVFLQSILPITPSPSLPSTSNLPSTTPTILQFDPITATASPKSPFKTTPITQTTQITQESSGDIQKDVLQPQNVQTNVHPVTSGVDSLNTNTSALVRQPSNNTNTGQVQNLPREEPPVKIQRNRGALLPSPPRIGPAQVASPTPAIEEQPLNQSQSVPDTEKIVQSSEETMTSIQPVQSIQQVHTETISLHPETEPQTSEVTEAKSTIGHKRSRNEIEAEQLCKSSLNIIFLIFILNI